MSEEKENGKTKQCKYCKQEIDAKAKICPHCRKKQTPSGCLIAVIAVVVIIVIAIAGSAMSGGEKTNTGASTRRRKQHKCGTAGNYIHGIQCFGIDG